MLTLESIKASLPENQLRHGADWLFSPRPLTLTKKQVKQITRLGHPLANFQRASESIYQRSAKGKLPTWISSILDAGKPEWLIQQQRSPELRESLPRVIRPDLIMTEDGFSLTELDSVPGGMGITTWLTQLYAKAGFDIIGGENGIPEGFEKILPKGGDILISEESADYRPEMEWIAEQVQQDITVRSVENIQSLENDAYRFFEWFDWQNIPAAKSLASSRNLTSPCKPHLEEKLWLALLWSPALQTLWKKEMRGNHLDLIKQVIPYGWVVDPSPMPPHAALPKLDVQSWEEVAEFSQTKRELVLKISGFNELAWGSRGVHIGHDMPTTEWTEAIQHATENFDHEPWVMQQFAHGELIEHPYFDPETGEEKIMNGRVRLCPYYFVDQSNKTSLGGILATIVPADKKKIHGMKDGILVPCVCEA